MLVKITVTTIGGNTHWFIDKSEVENCATLSKKIIEDEAKILIIHSTIFFVNRLESIVFEEVKESVKRSWLPQWLTARVTEAHY